jgi:hypothetical protein
MPDGEERKIANHLNLIANFKVNGNRTCATEKTAQKKRHRKNGTEKAPPHIAEIGHEPVPILHETMSIPAVVLARLIFGTVMAQNEFSFIVGNMTQHGNLRPFHTTKGHGFSFVRRIMQFRSPNPIPLLSFLRDT